MLKEIFIEDYKSLKNTKVSFKDGLNIIIGKNGSGKSNLLEFINKSIGVTPFLGNVKANDKYPAYNFEYNYQYPTHDKSAKFTVKVSSSDTTSEDGFPFTKLFISNTDTVAAIEPIEIVNLKKYDEYHTILNYLNSIPGLQSELINFNVPENMLWLDKPSTLNIKKVRSLISTHYINSNLDSLLFTSKFLSFFRHFTHDVNFHFGGVENHSVIKEKINEAFNSYITLSGTSFNLKNYSPIAELRIGPNINIYTLDDKILCENLSVEFKINDAWVPWSYLSDGTKRLFYLISTVTVYNEGILLIEEPELGVHPHQLYSLMNFLKEQSESKQIIISTHSPTVLDALEANELDRIIIAKLEEGKSNFNRLSKKQIEKAKAYITQVGSLSYYWMHSDLEQ